MSENVLIVSFSFEQVPAAFDVLTNAGLSPVVWKHDASAQLTDEQLISYWKGLENKPESLLIGADVQITAAFLNAAPTLKSVSLNCAGFDHVDLEACISHNVSVCNVPRRNFDAVADFAWGQILGLMRNVVRADKEIRAGRWCERVQRSAAVSKKTIGIIGMGAIGQAVAKRATGFDMDIVALSTSKKPELQERYGLRYLDGEAFFSEADVIVICCPGNEQTHHMINAQTLAWMKPSAFLVNPSRGSVVDTDALYVALRDGAIAGAALDVFEQEPLLDSPLFALDNVVLTPHIGGLADREIDGVAILSAGNLVRLTRGEPVANRIA